MKKLYAAGAIGLGIIVFAIGIAVYLWPVDYTRTAGGVTGDQALWVAIGGLMACVRGAFGLADLRSH